MKRSCKTFLCSFASAFVALVAIWVIFVTYCGRGYCSQPWFRDFHPLKRHFAAQKTSPKIVLYGGSSSLFGIDGEQLRRYTGMDNINFSSSILMPMRFYLADLERFVGEGDVVVLPLETSRHYCETESKVFSDFGLSCLLGVLPETKRCLSVYEIISLYANYGYSWVAKSLFHADGPLARIWAGETKQGVFEGLHSEKYVAEQWRRAALGEIPKTGHPWEMSSYGDWMRDLPARFLDVPGLCVLSEVTEEFLLTYHKIEALVKRRHGTLLLVWPNQYGYAEQRGMENLAQALRAQGIKICGRPEATAFPKSFYFEPLNHMNRQGARLWTRELAKTICAETGRPFLGGREGWPYVVFADDPPAHFPGVSRPETYASGVRLRDKIFPVELRLPEDLCGHDLDVSIVMKPVEPGGKSLKEVTCGATRLEFAERCFPVRSECRIFVPSNAVQTAALRLELVQVGASLGLERLFVSRASGGVSRFSGDYLVAHDTDVVRLVEGFSNIESWGCWTDGEVAELELVVPQRLRGTDLRLTFEAYTFVTDGHPVCAFSLASGGRNLGCFSSREFEYAFSVDVPFAYVKGETLPLTIQVTNPVSSLELGRGDDPRRLGVGLRRVRISGGDR